MGKSPNECYYYCRLGSDSSFKPNVFIALQSTQYKQTTLTHTCAYLSYSIFFSYTRVIEISFYNRVVTVKLALYLLFNVHVNKKKRRTKHKPH